MFSGRLLLLPLIAPADSLQVGGLYDVVIDVNQNGVYDLGIDIIDLVAEVGFEVTAVPPPPPPSITITAPSIPVGGIDYTTDATYTIRWTTENASAGTFVSLYSDTNRSGYDGTLIQGNISASAGSYEWNVSSLGSPVWIYAIIDDGVNPPDEEYSDAQVSPAPDISLSEQQHDFGTVPVGDQVDWELVVSNIGSTDLTVNSATSNNSAFSIPSPAFPQNVAPGGDLNITVRFLPASGGSYNGTLTIISDDPDESNRTVSLLGEGLQSEPGIQYIEYCPVERGETADIKIHVVASGYNLYYGIKIISNTDIRENPEPKELVELDPGESRVLTIEHTFTNY